MTQKGQGQATFDAFSCFFFLTTLSANVFLMGNSKSNLKAHWFRNALGNRFVMKKKTRKSCQCGQAVIDFIGIKIEGRQRGEKGTKIFIKCKKRLKYFVGRFDTLHIVTRSYSIRFSHCFLTSTYVLQVTRLIYFMDPRSRDRQ